MSTDTREDRLARRIADLYATDPQFAAAAPDDAISHAIDQPGTHLPVIVQTVLDGYAERPALGQRAVRFVTDPATGRTTTELLPRFETITYAELSRRIHAVTAALTDVHPGDRVAVLGFTSIDYTTVDMALAMLGAVAVPLQTSAPATTVRPIVAETEPVVIASSVDALTDAVGLALDAPTVTRLVVFDHRAGVDDHRDALISASDRLRAANSPIEVETITDIVARGSKLPVRAQFSADGDALSLLIYTSGSTGAPKGAMYPQHLVANSWRRLARSFWGDLGVFPAITLNFMPMSHVMGRGLLYGTLDAGGTAYFAARSDLSTFLEDLALVRPTQLSFVPRIWDTIHAEVSQELERRPSDATEVIADLRRSLLGGRYVTAMTGSAPLSPEMRAFVENLLDVHLIDGYGSTEAGAVFVDGRVQRPPVIDYKLVDVADLGYFSTDRPHPRGELLVKSETLFPGYYKRPTSPPRCSTKTATTAPATSSPRPGPTS